MIFDGRSFKIKQTEDGDLILIFPYMDITMPPQILKDLRSAGLGDNEELKNKSRAVVHLLYGKDPDLAIEVLNEFMELKEQIYKDEPIPEIPVTSKESHKINHDEVIARGEVSGGRLVVWVLGMYLALTHVFSVGFSNANAFIYVAIGILFYFRDYILTVTPKEEEEEEE